jgi:hypothetical protein
MATNGKLIPARPAAPEESAGYMPRIPWRLIALGAISLATVTVGYTMNQQRRADALRAQILHVYEQELAEPSQRYRAFRSKLEGLVIESARRAPDSHVDERLRLTGLRSGRGLYLRIAATDAGSLRGVERAASEMEADAIPACLGLSPASARAIWEKGGFLLPGSIKALRATEGVKPLQVVDTVLARHIRMHLPIVLDLIRSSWFLLVLEQPGGRRAHPVDVFLWDLHSGEQLLRSRVQSVGAALSARIKSKDAPGGPRLSDSARNDGAVVDCSIASQIKGLVGIPLASVENVQRLNAPGGVRGASPAPVSGAVPTGSAVPAGVKQELPPVVR